MICDEIPAARCAPEMIKMSCFGDEDEGIQISVPEANISSLPVCFGKAHGRAPPSVQAKSGGFRKSFEVSG